MYTRGNRKDYNVFNKNVHEVHSYCLDSNFWNSKSKIPNQFSSQDSGKVKIFIALQIKTKNQKRWKCSHIYEPLFKYYK